MDPDSQTLRKLIALGHGVPPAARVEVTTCAQLAVAKVGRRLFDVDAVLKDATQDDIEQKQLLKSAPFPGLLGVVGTADGRRGMLCFDGLLINAVVEIMTGAADGAIFREPRNPTLIDAALCREFSEYFLEYFVAEVNATAGQAILPEISYLHHETEAEKLAFELVDTAHTCLRGEVEFQRGIRGGVLLLALPIGMWDGGETAQKTVVNTDFTRCLENNVLESSLVLRADLDRFSLPLSRALALREGDMLPITASALSDISLVGEGGIVLLKGRLGQLNGKKAVMICDENTVSDLNPDGMQFALEDDIKETDVLDALDIELNLNHSELVGEGGFDVTTAGLSDAGLPEDLSSDMHSEL
jgi:flagellar motor switch protein FliM